MDCAPFKKPGQMTGLFSYRSVIPPSPREILLCKFSRGPRPPWWAAMRKRHIACDDFFAKIIARSFCCSSLPHKTLLAQIFVGTPAALAGGNEQALYCSRRLFKPKAPEEPSSGAFSHSFKARSKRSSRLSLTVRRRADRRGGRLSRSGRGRALGCSGRGLGKLSAWAPRVTRFCSVSPRAV